MGVESEKHKGYHKDGVCYANFSCLNSRLVLDNMNLKVVYGAYVLVVWSGPVISEEYSLEYGTDVMEMHVGAVNAGERALVIDDLIATGGTLCAAIKLLGL